MIATSQEEAAATLGINARTFGRWLRRGCPGKPRAYVIVDCIEWARENAWSEEAVLIEGATGEDGDLKTQLLKERIEKLRRDNTIADLNIGERSESLCDASAIRSKLLAMAGVLRSSLEKLERQYGPDALEIVLEALDEIDRTTFDTPDS